MSAPVSIRLKHAVEYLALAVVYIVVGKLSFMLASAHASVSPLWLPTGIALAAGLMLVYRVWPAIFLGAFLVNITTAGSVETALWIAVGNTLEGLLGAYLVNEFAHGRHVFGRAQDILKFAVLAGMIATAVSATCGVTMLAVRGFAEWHNYQSMWLTWWLGDMGGAVLITPLIMLWSMNWYARWDQEQIVEAILVLLMLVVLGQTVFGGWLPPEAINYPLAYLCIPLLVWTAFRFNPRETATVSVLLAGIAIWGTLRGFGPFVEKTPNESLLSLQPFMIITAVLALALSTIVHELKRMETIRKRLAAIVESSHDAIVGKTLDGIVTAWNAGAERLFGYSAKEVVGKPLSALYPPDRLDEERQILNRLREGERIDHFETVRRKKDGRMIHVSLSISPIKDETGAITGISKIARDISERKSVELVQTQLAAIVESSHDAIIGTTLDGIVTAWNAGAARLFGYSAKEVIGKPASILYPDDRLDEERQILDRLRRGERIDHFETVRRKKDGRMIHVSLSISPIKDETGAITGMSKIARDISERKSVELMQTQLAAIVESSHDAIVGKTLDGIVTAWNAGAERLFGYSAKEVIGKPVPALFPADRLEEERQILERLRRSERIDHFETVRRKKDGQRIDVSMTISPIKDETGTITGISEIARDISERKQVEKALAQVNQEMTTRVTELEHRSREITLLSDMAELLQACHANEEAYRVIGSFTKQLFPEESGFIGVCGPERIIEVAVVWQEPIASKTTFRLEECWALRRARSHIVAQPHSGPFCQHLTTPLPGNYICVPIMAESEMLGLLYMQGRQRQGAEPGTLEPLSHTTQQLAMTMTHHISLSMANLKLRDHLRTQAIRDSLTGLFNRRYLTELFELELRRAERNHYSIGVIMLDLDHFKKVNDRFGHPAGDALLIEVAKLLEANCRSGDLLCRYGGEEFIMIMPVASLRDTTRRAEALREAVRGLQVSSGNQALGQATISIGVAVFPDHGRTSENLIQAADIALYQAKQAGRDRVVTAGA